MSTRALATACLRAAGAASTSTSSALFSRGAAGCAGPSIGGAASHAVTSTSGISTSAVSAHGGPAKDESKET